MARIRVPQPAKGDAGEEDPAAGDIVLAGLERPSLCVNVAGFIESTDEHADDCQVVAPVGAFRMIRRERSILDADGAMEQGGGLIQTF